MIALEFHTPGCGVPITHGEHTFQLFAQGTLYQVYCHGMPVSL